MRIPAPIQGLHEGLPSAEQPIRTSFLLRNVRPFSLMNERQTISQRPGTTKAYSTQCSFDDPTTHPIIAMAQVVSTFIPPVAEIPE